LNPVRRAVLTGEASAPRSTASSLLGNARFTKSAGLTAVPLPRRRAIVRGEPRALLRARSAWWSAANDAFTHLRIGPNVATPPPVHKIDHAYFPRVRLRLTAKPSARLETPRNRQLFIHRPALRRCAANRRRHGRILGRRNQVRRARVGPRDRCHRARIAGAPSQPRSARLAGASAVVSSPWCI